MDSSRGPDVIRTSIAPLIHESKVPGNDLQNRALGGTNAPGEGHVCSVHINRLVEILELERRKQSLGDF